MRSSTQEARVARGEASYASFVLSKLPCFGSASYLHERTLMYEPIDNNGNWTEWSAIWAEIVRVISKSNELAVRVQFEITSMIADQICTTRSSITTLLHPFWNRPHFIDVVVSWFEVKFIHFFFFGGDKSFGNKSSRICLMILFVFHFPAIWLVTLNKPWNLSGCFVFNVASSLTGKKMWFKAKKWCVSWINRTN